MAKTDYGPEVKSAMEEKDSPAEIARDRRAGIKQGSPRDVAMDAKDKGPQPSQKDPPMHYVGAMPHAQQAAMGNPEQMARMQHAAGIAHAILGGRKVM